MKKSVRMLSAAAVCLASIAGSALGQAPLGTGITYQGKLKLSGAALNSTADFQFRLFDSPTGGSQIGSTLSQNGVTVQDGLFTQTLDFGAAAFNGDARWLEVAVRSPAGTGNFVILTPRQAMTAAPYAQVATKPWTISGNNVIYNTGRVGVGPSSPTSLLDLNGTQDALKIRASEPFMTLTDTSSGNARVQLQNSGGRFFITPETFLNGTNSGSFTMVDSQGRIGIGTFNPTSRVEIAGQDGLAITGFQPFITLRDTNAGGARGVISTGNGDIGFYSNGALARQSPSVIIKDNDWVGMGVGTPGFRLDLPNIGSTDGRARANQWVTYSSGRWKQNVQTIENALDKVMHLRGVSFDWKPEHGGAHDVGFVAEEVGKVLPELVTWEKDGTWAQGLAYDHITAVTVEAIKEQQKQIQSLEQVNAELRERIEELAKLVAERDSK